MEISFDSLKTHYIFMEKSFDICADELIRMKAEENQEAKKNIIYEKILRCKQISRFCKTFFEQITILEQQNKQLLNACWLAYLKHHFDEDGIGWDELDNVLENTIANAIGDKEFSRLILKERELLLEKYMKNEK